MEKSIEKIGLVLLIILFFYSVASNNEFLFILIFLLFIALFFYLITKLLIAFYRIIKKQFITNNNVEKSKDEIAENKSNARKSWPYRKKNYFFNQTEREFYYILNDILGDKYLLFSKVRMSDLLYLPEYLYHSYHYQNKIQSKHVDFLICEKQNIKPLLAIELDGSSHLRDDRIERDKEVNEIFKDANLPILHIKVSDHYDKAYLFDVIRKEIELDNVQSEYPGNI